MWRKEPRPPSQVELTPHSQACRQLKGLLGVGECAPQPGEMETHCQLEEAAPQPHPTPFSCRPPPALTPDSLCRGKKAFSFLTWQGDQTGDLGCSRCWAFLSDMC